MRYRLVIFDFDGTLADSFGWFLGSFNDIATAHGCSPLDLDRLHDYRGVAPRELMAMLDVPLWKLPRIAASMRRSMDRDIGSISLFPGAPEVLAALRAAGIRTALVTSNSERNARRVLGDAAALIDHYGCGVPIFGKRAVLRRILRQTGVAAGAALAVGDELRDVEAASAAGIDFIGVGWGYATAEALAAATRRSTFANFSEILAAATAEVRVKR